MSGSIVKRCPCPPAYSVAKTGKRTRLACKIKHGSWSLIVGGKDPGTGERRQHRESGFETKEAAQRRLAEIAASGTLPAKRAVTFASYAGEWLDAPHPRGELRPVTRTDYQTAINTACRAFGALAIGDVTRGHVERMVRAMADAGRAQRTTSVLLFVVRSIFARALDEGLITRNPAANVSALGRAPKDRTALSAGDLGKLRMHIDSDRLKAAWMLTMYGLRRSEVMGLRWNVIDLVAGELTVDHGVVADVSGKRSPETPPKTTRGRRTLPLPPDVLAALRELRERQAAAFGFEHVRTGYLAVDEAGVPLRPERWSDMWTRLCKAAGVPPVTLHAARHSSVTAMRAAGVPDDVVARWHGHDENVMRRTYSHPDAIRLASAGQALSDVFGSKAAPMAT
jgi:integrase